MDVDSADRAKERVALVMAASKGIGRGCAQELAQAGYNLVICARDVKRIEETATTLRSFGGKVIAVSADVAKAADIEAVYGALDESFGRIDVLIANAGGPPPSPFLNTPEANWQIGFELTMMSAVRAMRMAVQRMQPRQYGRIVVIGSSSVKQPIPGLVVSNAFRPALLGVVKTLAQEVAAAGITVNMVSPGRIDTDRVRELDEARAKAGAVAYDQVRAANERSIPAQRYGSPAEIGALIAFLASEAAGYVTGQSILVDGGMLPAL
jgi:3-oxoacyl-[acyl-carrier protein] reductase